MTKVFLTSVGAGEYVIPAGVTTLTSIKCIGGGASATNYSGGGTGGKPSGGGGEFAQKNNYSVTASTTYDYNVGAGADWNGGKTGANGGNSWFTTDGGNDDDIVLANGGVGGGYYNSGSGGPGGTGEVT